METELTVNYLSTNFSDFSKWSDATTESGVGEETFKWTDAEIARLIQIIVRPIFLIGGTMGNGLSFYIMRKTSLKDVSSCFYMSILALADTSKYFFNVTTIFYLGYWKCQNLIITSNYRKTGVNMV